MRKCRYFAYKGGPFEIVVLLCVVCVVCLLVQNEILQGVTPNERF
jgi:hypothetical protein